MAVAASPQPARHQERRNGDHGQRCHQREHEDSRQDDEEDDPGHGKQERGQQGDSESGAEIDQLLEHLAERRCGCRRRHAPKTIHEPRCDSRCHRPRLTPAYKSAVAATSPPGGIPTTA
jgi:hypothetical protein